MTGSNSTTNLRRAVLTGAGAGVIASMAMASYAMIASWQKGTGFFTPLFHIASLWASKDSMTASMQAAVAGDAFQLALGPAVLGAVIHMMTGAMYGAAFGVIAWRLAVGAAALAGLGLAYGFVVFAMSAYVALPVSAAVFGSGDEITHMASMAGWGTFVVEHLLFGLSLGALVAMARAHAMPARALLATR